MIKKNEKLPVVVIGAGPIGLAAAANLLERGITPAVLESGPQVAASMRQWGHVRVFTPWSYLVDPATQRLLEKNSNWSKPNEKTVPLAKEFVEQYLDPFVNLDIVKPTIHLDHHVTAISRLGHDRLKDGNRNQSPFLVVMKTPSGMKRILAEAVIDASGTWTTPNPLGAGGISADGEQDLQEHILYGMPDVLGTEKNRYAGKRTLVVGSGHSAIGTVLSLAELRKESPETQVAWAVRRKDPRKLWRGGDADEIKERGFLGTRVHKAVHSEEVTLLTGFSISAIKQEQDGIGVYDLDGECQVVVDQIVVAAGARPDLQMLRELRLEMDLATEAPKQLGPLIDPNHHSCGTVPPHGVEELSHPEENFFLVGMKSYGRAPTFLMRTGYEQVRSIAAELAGDHVAARTLELELPETGVCSTDLAAEDGVGSGSCC